MIAGIYTVCFRGIQAIPIHVQVQVVSGGLPSFSIVGLPDKAVNESRERIRSALQTLGLALPPKRITINLSPADIQKEGSHYDLPIALGLLSALEVLPLELEEMIALGELGLDGGLKPVQGILSAAVLAASQNKALICPWACGGEAVWGGEIDILAAPHLMDLIHHFKGHTVLERPQGQMESLPASYGDFAEVQGQEGAKRALTIAAAGQHNLLMMGPQGTGKSMLASRLLSILPPLSAQEAIEVTMIHSMVDSAALKERCLMRARPFRTPHHSVSMAALVGGGMRGLPGEVSLAHCGILFLDELLEFSRAVLDALRQSLETKQAVVARANYRAVYPAHFQLIAAMNPCPCGFFGDPLRQCRKAPACAKDYQRVLSGPFLDRMDMGITVPTLSLSHVQGNALRPPESPGLFAQIQRSFKCRESLGLPLSPSSTALDQEIEKSPGKPLLFKAFEAWNMSLRAYYRIIGVARTIACLEQAEIISRAHLSEALSYALSRPNAFLS